MHEDYEARTVRTTTHHRNDVLPSVAVYGRHLKIHAKFHGCEKAGKLERSSHGLSHFKNCILTRSSYAIVWQGPWLTLPLPCLAPNRQDYARNGSP